MGIFSIFSRKKENKLDTQKSKFKDAVKELKDKLEHCCD